MAKKKGGKRVRRGKKTYSESNKVVITKDSGQDYFRVLQMLGDCRVKVVNMMGDEKIGVIRGKFRKRVWINVGDIVIAGLRSFEVDKVDIIHKYRSTEAKQLVKMEEIDRNLLGECDEGEDDEDDDGINWNISEEEEEVKSMRRIAPQREIKNIEDISSDSYEYENVDMKTLLDQL